MPGWGDENEEHRARARGWEPDESGARARPDDEVLTLDDDDLEELAHLERTPRSTPPPTPVPRPPERFDLDAILREASKMPLTSTMDAPEIPAPRDRPSWTTSIVLSSAMLLVGACAAALVLLAYGPERASVPSVAVITPSRDEARPPSEDRRAERPTEATAPRFEPTETNRDGRGSATRSRTSPSTPSVGLARGHAAPPGVRAEHPAPRSASESRAAARRTAGTESAASRSSAATRRTASTHTAATPTASTHTAAARTGSQSRAASIDSVAARSTGERSPRRAIAARRGSGRPERSAAERATASVEPLPERPGRADVEHAVNTIIPALRACGAGMGAVHLELHFVSNGRLTTARVDAARATPSQRSCIARAARSAHVPPFSAPSLTVRYPITL